MVRLPAAGQHSDTLLSRLEGRGSPAHQVWLPPSDGVTRLDILLQRAGSPTALSVPIGVVEVPLCAGSRCVGRTTRRCKRAMSRSVGVRGRAGEALQTLILALAEIHDPRDAQVYCLDFGGGECRRFVPLPHVGLVAGSCVSTWSRGRSRNLSRCCGQREARRGSGEFTGKDDPYGEVFLVIDGWAAVRHEFEAMEASITKLAAQGLSYGIHGGVLRRGGRGLH